MSAFWDWALERYARPGVEALLIDLQDVHGQCVPYLLWAAWGAAPALLERGAHSARSYEAEVVGPLRRVRRRLRGDPPLHDQVKAAELAAEKVLMETLEAMGPPATAGGIEDAVRIWGVGAPADDLKRLATLLR